MNERSSQTLWKLLWDYDPNGLVVVDQEMRVTLVNPAFCAMFKTNAEALIGSDATALLGDMTDFRHAWETGTVLKAKEKAYPDYDLYVRKVIFPIHDEDIIACIMVDVTHEWQQQQEMLRLKKETVAQVNAVVDKQMKVAQQIASLLGETTAETKVSLIKLRRTLEQEIG